MWNLLEQRFIVNFKTVKLCKFWMHQCSNSVVTSDSPKIVFPHQTKPAKPVSVIMDVTRWCKVSSETILMSLRLLSAPVEMRKIMKRKEWISEESITFDWVVFHPSRIQLLVQHMFFPFNYSWKLELNIRQPAKSEGKQT